MKHSPCQMCNDYLWVEGCDNNTPCKYSQAINIIHKLWFMRGDVSLNHKLIKENDELKREIESLRRKTNGKKI